MIDLQCPNNAGGIAALNSHRTGSDAWIQRSSMRSMFSVVDNDFLRTASNLGSSVLPVHGAVLRRYISRPSVNTFRSKYKMSCDGISSNRFDSRSNSWRLHSSIASRLWPTDSGAPSKTNSAGLVSGRFMSCDAKSDRVQSERPMISRLLRFNSSPVVWRPLRVV